MKALYFNYYIMAFSLYMIVTGSESIHYPTISTILIFIGGTGLFYTLKELINEMDKGA
jgi:hypothetical protein